MRTQRLGIRSSACGREHTLALSGELDLASADALSRRIRHVCSTGVSVLVLDLSELTFMDSTGLHAVLATDELCRRNACDLRVKVGNGPIRRVVEICGLLDAPFVLDRGSTSPATA